MRNITFKQLEAVYEVARRGTIIKAAAVLHVTPGALTTRIKLLEDDLGLALFDRTGNRLRPTDAGREAISTAARIDRAILDLADTLGSMKGLQGGCVRFGAASTAKYFAAEMIAAFMKKHPGIELKLEIGNRAAVIDALRDYESDIVLMGRPPGDFPVDSQPFGAHPLVVIAAFDHPLARRRSISKAEFTQERFLLREEGSGTRNAYEYFFAGATGPWPRNTIEMGSNETIKQAVIAGLGISLISAHTIAQELAAKRLAILKVEGLPILRQWYVVKRSGRDLPPAASALWNFIVAHGSRFLPK